MSDEKIVIAVPSITGDGLKSLVTPRFGRCNYFTLVTIDKGEVIDVKVIDNPGAKAMGGAGPLAVQTVVQQGATAVAGGDYGPNASGALNAARVKTYGRHPTNPNPTVKNIIEAFQSNSLPQISGATSPGFHQH